MCLEYGGEIARLREMLEQSAKQSEDKDKYIRRLTRKVDKISAEKKSKKSAG